MDTNTQTTAETALDEPTPEQRLRADYPAVTQYKGRTYRYAPLEPGQLLVVQHVQATIGDSDGVSLDTINELLSVMEGCIGPDQMRTLRKDLALKSIGVEDVTYLLVKIAEGTQRNADREAKRAGG